MKHLINGLFCVFCSVFLFSCSSDDYTYTPPSDFHLFATDVLLSIEKTDGQLYGDYETLLKNKQISIMGVASRKEIPIEVVEEEGVKYLHFVAELPNESDMKIVTDATRWEETGSTDVIIMINKKALRVTCSFVSGGLKYPFIGDPVIGLATMQYKNSIVKESRTEPMGKFKVILRQKVSSDDFILTC